ncbi:MULTISPECIES: hypothetical protein [unclassified Nonomuraea]|nr:MULTISPECIES: hypothetical protein [unclassified Nonomuraea]NBE96684.1 hypothetical protein [Nonomuraea sp. K271]
MSLGWDAGDASFVLFSRNGFSSDLETAAAEGQVRLLDLEGMYASG